MYPLFRLTSVYLNALQKPAMDFNETSVISFRCRPWDLDMFMEMNNGRILTLYDLGRFDLALRIGLMKVLRENKWGLAVAGGSNRFRRRVHLFDKVRIKTQAVGYDERWLYLAQSMWVKGQATSSGLLRTCVTEKGKAIHTSRLMDALGIEDPYIEMPNWVDEWRNADDHRPWPPVQI